MIKKKSNKNQKKTRAERTVAALVEVGLSSYKVEVFLKGEFTTIDVYLEGKEIPLREVDDNEYYKLYTSFDIINPLDIHVRLKGWFGMDWNFEVRVNNKQVYSNDGVFDVKGFVTFTEHVNI
jgi:hypothetical protein